MTRYRPPTPASSPYITAGGHRRLREELEALWSRRREVVVHLGAAAAEGDRSENAEYIYRKKQLREIDRRIRYLQRRLPVLKVVSDPPAQRDRVYFGASVTVMDDDGAEYRYRIVGADETDSAAADISVDSPVARALLGKALDQDVSVRTPSGERQVTIVAIDYSAASPG
jgi:transcription elongation factor GreB